MALLFSLLQGVTEGAPEPPEWAIYIQLMAFLAIILAAYAMSKSKDQ